MKNRIQPIEIWQHFTEQQSLEVLEAEPPVAMTPMEDVYQKALEKANGETKPEPVKQDPEVIKEAAPAKKEAAKPTPKSALDAALNGGQPEVKPEPVIEEDPLKEFPENAKDANWKRARELIGKQHGELKELRGKAGKSEPDPAILSELQTVKQTLKEREAALAERETKLAEYNDAMTALNVSLHPDHRREFIDGRNELVQSAVAKLKSYGGDPESLKEALDMPEGKRRDAAIEEALESLETDTAKDKVRRYVSEIEALDERRDKAMKDPQRAYEELERKTAAQRQKQSTEAEQVKATEFERITRELHKTIPTLALVDDSVDGGKEWNASVKQAREDAFKLFSSDATFPDLVTTAVKGKDYDRVTNLLIAERKETATLRAQLAQFDESQPVIKGGKPAAKNAKDAALDRSPGDLYNETMAKLSGGEDS